MNKGKPGLCGLLCCVVRIAVHVELLCLQVPAVDETLLQVEAPGMNKEAVWMYEHAEERTIDDL